MAQRSRMRSLFVLLAVGTVLMLAAPVVSAAPRTQGANPQPAEAEVNVAPHFWIRGQLRQIPSQQDYPKGAGVLFRDISHYPLQLANVKYFVVTGRQVNGHTEYPFDMVLDRFAAGRFTVTEVAQNPVGRTVLVAAGVSTARKASTTRAAEQHQTVATGTATSPLTSSGCHNGQYDYAYQDSEWLDPIGLILTDVEDDLNWCWDGTYVTSYHGWDSASDDQQSAWSMTYHSTYDWAQYNQWYQVLTAGHKTQANFVNSQFCSDHHLGSGSTYVYYNTNNVYGYQDGNFSGSVNTWDSGACTGLMWQQQSVGIWPY